MMRDDWSREKIHFVTGTRDQLEPSAPVEGTVTFVRMSPTFGMVIEARSRCTFSVSASCAATDTG